MVVAGSKVIVETVVEKAVTVLVPWIETVVTYLIVINLVLVAVTVDILRILNKNKNEHLINNLIQSISFVFFKLF